MTRTAITKLAATALAVASLGLTASAQAADQNIVAGENDIKVTPSAPATPATPATPEAPKPAETTPAQEEEEIDYSSPEYFKSDEAKKRFNEQCKRTDGSSPSHNDAKFCEDFKKNNGTGAGSSSTGNHGRPDYCKYQNVRYDPACDIKEPKPTPEKYNCHDYDKHSDYYKKYCYKPGYTKHYEKPAYHNKTSEPSKGELPFTGLEIWQLGLLGLVLGGGGLGVRRLLAS